MVRGTSAVQGLVTRGAGAALQGTTARLLWISWLKVLVSTSTLRISSVSSRSSLRSLSWLSLCCR